jgi:hypothetical protein
VAVQSIIEAERFDRTSFDQGFQFLVQPVRGTLDQLGPETRIETIAGQKRIVVIQERGDGYVGTLTKPV